MHYAKHKRGKIGECTICRQIRELTWDHIPPKVAGNVAPVFLVSALSAISGRPQEKPKLSQSGYMVRSICGECNSCIGGEYDPVIGDLCSCINHYLKSPLTMPPRATFETVPARLLRGLLAHLLAAKLTPTEGVLDPMP